MFGINMGNDSHDDIKVVVDDELVKQAKDKKDMALVGAIDQGTSSSRFVVFTFYGQILASAQTEHTQYFPPGEDKVGWHEHDPIEIWEKVVSCVDAVTKALKNRGLSLEKRPLKTVGITNQRETTIVWNSETGVPYYNAIVWDDLRTVDIAAEIANGDPDRFRKETGLPLASYFAGTKVKWLLDNVPELQEDLKDTEKASQVRFGTVDTWLMYQLTGKKSLYAEEAANVGGIFITDVSNASRWLFLDLHTCEWDPKLVNAICSPHSLPLSALPEIRSSSEVYATCSKSCGINVFDNVPIAGVLGDQQAALFGQCAFSPGEAKCTFGTGLFLLMNTGEKIVQSTHGLLTTAAYQLGKDQPVHYGLEGSISHSGSTIQWLRDQICLIEDAPESETFARTVEHNDGVYFVPAFSGLFAPHWRSDARACIVGMTASCNKGHLCRAALEAAAYQTRELFDAINADSHVSLRSLRVDGGGTANNLLMQFQADMLDIDVVKPVVMETTSRGAAFAAGLAVGVWSDVEEVHSLWSIAQTFKPSMAVEERDAYWKGWQKAVSKSIGWIEAEEQLTDPKSRALSLVASKPKKAGYSGTSMAMAIAASVALGFLLGGARKS